MAAQKGQKDVALTEIHRALELAPNEAALHETLALLEAGDASQSPAVEAELKKSVELDPKSVNAKLLLAAYYLKNNRLQEAEHACWSAVATDPKNLGAREALVQVILREGDRPRAEQVLRQTSDELADNPQGVRILADYYVRTGQTDKAKAEFASLSQKYPKNLAVQEGYVRILLDLKDNATAQSVIAGMMKKQRQGSAGRGAERNCSARRRQGGGCGQCLAGSGQQCAQGRLDSVLAGQGGGGQGRQRSGGKELSPGGAIESARRAGAGGAGALRLAARRHRACWPTWRRRPSPPSRATPAAIMWRAAVELSHNTPDKAEDDLKTAISVAPQSAQAYLMLGELRFAQKKYPESNALLEQALQYDPNSIGAMRGLIRNDLFKKQPAQALERLNAQIAKSPRNSGFLDLLAQLQIQGKNLDQAAATSQKAMEINPEDGEAVSIYAALLMQNKQTANAIGVWEQWSKAHPNNAAVLAILGMLEESRNDRTKAEDYYKRALQIQPTQAIAANNLAYMMLENGENVDVALGLAQTARRGMPNSPNSADTLAWAYYHKGTYGFARDLLEEAVKIDPNSATKQYHLGMVYSKMMEKDNAAVHLKKAISLDPNSQAAKDARTALQGLG